ncbi:MAG: carbon storage regulator [Myxococcota bacterium]
MMLTLTRRVGERIYIGDDVVVEVVSIGPNRVRIGVRALKSVPIVRGELLERASEANREASTPSVSAPADVAIQRRNDALHFSRGLLGFESFKRWVLCDLADAGANQMGLRILVAQDQPSIRLLVADLELLDPSFPFEAAAAKADLDDEDVVFAAVVNVPVDGRPATVNLAAPLVLGVPSREGVQVVLGMESLAVDTPIQSIGRASHSEPAGLPQ